jgi:hypothetical protein
VAGCSLQILKYFFSFILILKEESITFFSGNSGFGVLKWYLLGKYGVYFRSSTPKTLFFFSFNHLPESKEGCYELLETF